MPRSAAEFESPTRCDRPCQTTGGDDNEGLPSRLRPTSRPQHRMALTLTYRGKTTVPVEVEGIVPAVLREMSLADIEKLSIYYGNRQLPLAEFFAIAGDPSDEQLTFVGDLAGVHWI